MPGAGAANRRRATSLGATAFAGAAGVECRDADAHFRALHRVFQREEFPFTDGASEQAGGRAVHARMRDGVLEIDAVATHHVEVVLQERPDELVFTLIEDQQRAGFRFRPP